MGREFLEIVAVGNGQSMRRRPRRRRHDIAVSVGDGDAERLRQPRQALHHPGVKGAGLQRAGELRWIFDTQRRDAIRQVREHKIDRLNRSVDLIGDHGGDIGGVLGALGEHDRAQPQNRAGGGRCRNQQDQQRGNGDCAHRAQFRHSRRLRSVHVVRSPRRTPSSLSTASLRAGPQHK
jgi:hypothetical protein